MVDMPNPRFPKNFDKQIQAQIADSALDWAWAIDVNGVHIYSNKAIEKLLGYRVEEIVGKFAFPLIHPDDQERVREIVQKALEEQKGWEKVSLRWVHKDGSIRYFESTSRAFFTEEGLLGGFCGIDRDITKRLEAENALQNLNQQLEQQILDRTQELEDVVDNLQQSLEEKAKIEAGMSEINLRYQALFEGAADSIFIISLQDEILAVNQQAATLLGYPLEELENMPLSELMPPDEWEDAENKTNRLFAGEILPPYERIALRKGGEKIPVEVILTLIRDKDGDPKYFQSIVRDISERKKIEAALRESEAKFRLAFESGPLGIVLSDQDMKIVDVNQQYCRLTGCGPDCEIIGFSFDKYTHPDDFQEERVLYRKLFDSEIPGYKIEKRYIKSSGEAVWVKWTASLLQDEEGNPQYALGIVEDITDRKKADEKLRASEERFRAFFNHAGYAISLSKGGQTLLVNQAYLDLFGYGEFSDVIGRPLNEQVAPEERERIYEHSKLRTSGVPVENFYETLGIKKDGTIFDIDVRVSTYRMDEEIYTLAILRDISERKKNEEEIAAYREHLEQVVEERTVELQNSNEELKAFAYSVSHDLRAPVRAISGFGDILVDEYGDVLDDDAKDYLERIIDAGKKMDELIVGLLEFSRASYSDFSVTTVNLSTLAEEALQHLKQSDPQRQVEIEIQPNISADGDLRLLRVVMDNLLENAWKYTKKKSNPKIEFRCKEESAGKVYFVRDNGIGFDMEEVENIFKVFHRLQSAEEYEGTGIGLATVQKIIQRHGGKIWTEAEAGKGAAFFFTLNKKQH